MSTILSLENSLKCSCKVPYLQARFTYLSRKGLQLLFRTSCCFCFPLNTKGGDCVLDLSSSRNRLTHWPAALNFCASPLATVLKTAKWLTRPGISVWVCECMGYWVTLPISVAAVFHQSSKLCWPFSAYLVHMCLCFCLWVEWDCRDCPFMSKWIRPFPDSVGWHMQALLSFTSSGNKPEWNV